MPIKKRGLLVNIEFNAILWDIFSPKIQDMYENQILDDQHSNQLFITQAAKASLKTAASWSFFLAILGFIGVGFLVLAGLMMGAMSGALSGMLAESGAFPFPVWILSFFYFAMAALYFFPMLYLFKFASNMKSALASDSTPRLTEAFVNLGRHYKILGIMIIAFFALYILGALAFLTMAGSMVGSL
jgi:hypothetical protein